MDRKRTQFFRELEEYAKLVKSEYPNLKLKIAVLDENNNIIATFDREEV